MHEHVALRCEDIAIYLLLHWWPQRDRDRSLQKALHQSHRHRLRGWSRLALGRLRALFRRLLGIFLLFFRRLGLGLGLSLAGLAGATACGLFDFASLGLGSCVPAVSAPILVERLGYIPGASSFSSLPPSPSTASSGSAASSASLSSSSPEASEPSDSWYLRIGRQPRPAPEAYGKINCTNEG